MPQLFTNNASAFTTGTVAISATSLTVTAGYGNKFPVVAAGDYCLVTLCAVSAGIETDWEIVKVTARESGSDTFTIIKNWDGRGDRYWPAGTRLELRETADMLARHEAKVVSIKDFGATGNGYTDDTTAVNLALASGAVSIYVPKGTYKITGNLTRGGNTYLYGDTSNASRFIMEGTSSFVYTGTGSTYAGDPVNGLDGQFHTTQLVIERIGFIATGNNNGSNIPTSATRKVLDLQWTNATSGGAGTMARTLTLRDIEVVACPPTNYTTTPPTANGTLNGMFGYGIYIAGAANVTIDSVNIQGPRISTRASSGIGLHFEGEDATFSALPCEIFVVRCNISFLNLAISFEKHNEGVQVFQCRMLECMKDVRATTAGDGASAAWPMVYVTESHMSYYDTGIEFDGFANCIVANCNLLNLYNSGSFTGSSFGVMFNNLTGKSVSLMSRVINNDIAVYYVGAAASDRYVIGVHVNNTGGSENVVIEGNTFSMGDQYSGGHTMTRWGINANDSTNGVKVGTLNQYFSVDSNVRLGPGAVLG